MRSRSVAKLRFGKCHFLDPSTLSQEHIPHHPTNPGPALFLEIGHLYKRRGHRSKPAGTWSSGGIFHSGSGAPHPPKSLRILSETGEFLRRLRRERSIKKPTLLVANVHSHVLWFPHVHSMHILWQTAGIIMLMLSYNYAKINDVKSCDHPHPKKGNSAELFIFISLKHSICGWCGIP